MATRTTGELAELTRLLASAPVVIVLLVGEGDHARRPGVPPRAVDLRKAGPADPRWAQLSERDRHIARLVGSALTNQQIAHRIGRSPHTVNYHLRRIFRQLGIGSRVELAALAQRHRPASGTG